MIFSTKSSLLFTVVSLLVLLAGCGSAKVVEETDQYTSTVEQIDIPDNVKIIGLGEATHGNIEFQELKKDVFKVLVKNERLRVFVLEGDFGGGQRINQFILNGNGTAEEAVNTLDYSIYKTEQMVDLVQWMHDYNATVSGDEKVYFYGNDMQRYDYSKKGVLDYYKVVNADVVKKYASQLKHASTNKMRKLTMEQLNEIDETIENIILDLQSNEVTYVEQTSTDSYAFALQYAKIMKQRTQLFLNEGDYMKLRDQYLADNLQWIVEFEATRGHDKIFITGHNGHIEKTSASLAGYKSMGNYLDELYGEEYFAIGTDFIISEFQAKNGGSGERQSHTLENHNDLVDAFSKVESNIFYVDFGKASETDELLDIITREQKMPNIGDDFRAWYKFLKTFYTIEMTPNEAYDGIIIVKVATPTNVIE
ncbi:erythromycin esterase family protein [Peribacillus huizhouensis]|uniref:Erythromycin esterase n=1 Tax=Peribacillus huizhouensis TaxID=1501239 RepID=A0ABR6CTS1_9BACI|nr:erythromycin esterase family protein [Peribacillus huizhouensis]MBA9028424.1 erythromycin esterase [Peribacillus huizhouensis]